MYGLQQPRLKRKLLAAADAAVKNNKASNAGEPHQQPQEKQRLTEAHRKAHSEIVHQAENAEDQYKSIYDAAVFHSFTPDYLSVYAVLDGAER